MPIVNTSPYFIPQGWDLPSSQYEKSFDVSSKETDPAGVAFSPDGMRMYVVGFITVAVHQYALTVAWDIGSGTTSFVQTKSVPPSVNPKEVLFNFDGTKMYISDGGFANFHQYSLGTAWDISTITDDLVPYDFTLEDTNPLGVTFKSNGKKLYMVGIDNDLVHQYSLGTAWDIDTMSYDSVTKLISGEETGPTGITFKSDGTIMYITGFTNKVYQYPLSSAWDLSTAGATSGNVNVATPPETQTRGVIFKPDGSKMYTVGDSSNAIHQFTNL